MAFGPIPSRRLGCSLGVNNVLPKACSYSCVYCQVGRTAVTEVEPRPFHPPDELVAAVTRRVHALRERDERVDYLTFVADGEPTLDVHLGREIEGLRPLGIPIAVLTNGSLLWRDDVRRAVARADWVSLKVDAADETTWRKLNRPHRSLSLATVFEGMLRFAGAYSGTLASETMLVHEVNDGEAEAVALAAVLARLRPSVAYVAVPTRPPADAWVRPADEASVNRCYHCLAQVLPRVELLTEFEGDALGTTGDADDDLLANAAVHPMREDAALALLARAGADRSVLERLTAEGRLRPVPFRGHVFYVRPFPPAGAGPAEAGTPGREGAQS